jgi:hypothetical protein
MKQRCMLYLAMVMAITSSASYADTGHYEWSSLPFGGGGLVSTTKDVKPGSQVG